LIYKRYPERAAAADRSLIVEEREFLRGVKERDLGQGQCGGK